MNPADETPPEHGPSRPAVQRHKGGVLPFTALAVSIFAALSLVVLVFMFSDPAGDDVGPLVYILLAILIGFVGMFAWRMARKAIREARPHRFVSLLAGCFGVATANASVAFLLVGYAAPPLARWLVWA